MMKHLLTFLLLSAAMLLSAQVKVIGTTRPVTALTKAVTASVPGYQVTILLPEIAGCPHDYSLTPADMKRLSGAGIIVINGGGMESFLDGVIKRVCPNAKIVDASKGILPERKHTHCSNPTHCKHHHYHHNEHILASPGMAAKAVHAIGSQMRAINADKPEIAKQIGENTLAYFNKLKDIQTKYLNFSRTVPFQKKRVLAQHSIFDYLAKEAGLEVKGTIFQHDMQEPSASDAAKLIRKVKKEKIFAILAEPGKKSRMTDMIAKECGIPVIYLNVNPKTDSPDEFLKMFADDLEILKKAVQ